MMLIGLRDFQFITVPMVNWLTIGTVTIGFIIMNEIHLCWLGNTSVCFKQFLASNAVSMFVLVS